MPLWKKVLSYPFFLAGAAAVLFVLVLFEAIQRAAYAVSRGAQERAAYYLNRSLWLCLKLVGARLEVKYHGVLPPPGQVIIVSNHQSMFDIVLISMVFDAYRPKFIAKTELARGIPSVSFNLRYGGNVIIDRKNREESVEILRRSLARLREDGASIVIFPEGGRSRNGEPGPFKPKGLSVLLEELPEAPVIPVAIDNSWIFTANPAGPIPLGITLKVAAGPVLRRSPLKSQEDFQEKIRETVLANLKELRSDGVRRNL